MKEKVFVTRRFPGKGIEMLREHAKVEVWEHEIPPKKQEIISHAEDCDGLITLLSDNIDSGLIDEIPELKVIAQYAVGYDNIDIEAATSRGIIVTNTPEVLTETTADLTWALIMAASRRVVQADKYVRNGNWQVAWGPDMLLGKDVYGKTLGILGLGRIGAAVAKRARGFSMRVLYHSRSQNDRTRQIEDQTGAKRVDLDTLLKESDIVSVHVPLTEETRGMLGKDELLKMKKGSILVNTARGPIIDEEALYDLLIKEHLFSAGLDVFREEPIETGNNLLHLANVVLLPHIGSASEATRAKMGVMCAENMIAGLKGEKPPNIVNPEVLDDE